MRGVGGAFFTESPATDVLIGAVLVLSLALTAQSIYTLYLMLYTWDQPDAYRKAQAPKHFLPPSITFTVLLPARHEEDVIATTIQRVVHARYPRDMLEVVVICAADDVGTIAEAERGIRELQAEQPTNARVLTFADTPINKPHGLNVGFRNTRHEVVTIFDSEDDIHPDIFNIVNTVMAQENVRVVQCGVQLMNFHSSWYSALNVLEYFFWFKSRLHYHARMGMTPLGGNTVFFARAVLADIGGWDERNLTEDADVGIRLSVLGEPIRIVYDDAYVTREETPPTLGHFIKQRTRWSQGFLQTFKKGQWRELHTRDQRLMAAYTLGFPTAQAILGAYLVVSIVMMFTLKTPVLTAIILALPLYLLAAHFLLAVLGLYEFTSAHGLKPTWKTPVLMALGYLPYQWLLSYASLRATLREVRGINNWEKTAHVGAHRQANAPIVDRRPATRPVVTRVLFVAALLAAVARPTQAAPAPPPLSEAVSSSVDDLLGLLTQDSQLVRDDDLRSRLRVQHALANGAYRASEILRHDSSPEAVTVRWAISDVRAGIEGDAARLARAEGVLRALRDRLPVETPASPVVTAVTTGDPLTLLEDDLAAFRAALQAGDTAPALPLQGHLSNDALGVELEFRYVPTRQAEQARAALEQLALGLDGDPDRLAATAALLLAAR